MPSKSSAFRLTFPCLCLGVSYSHHGIARRSKCSGFMVLSGATPSLCCVRTYQCPVLREEVKPGSLSLFQPPEGKSGLRGRDGSTLDTLTCITLPNELGKSRRCPPNLVFCVPAEVGLGFPPSFSIIITTGIITINMNTRRNIVNRPQGPAVANAQFRRGNWQMPVPRPKGLIPTNGRVIDSDDWALLREYVNGLPGPKDAEAKPGTRPPQAPLTVAWTPAWADVHGCGKSRTGGRFCIMTLRGKGGAYLVKVVYHNGEGKRKILWECEMAPAYAGASAPPPSWRVRNFVKRVTLDLLEAAGK
jgi:hypothetical protein